MCAYPVIQNLASGCIQKYVCLHAPEYMYKKAQSSTVHKCAVQNIGTNGIVYISEHEETIDIFKNINKYYK